MSDPLIGKQLGDYVIQSLLGRGGMARVYKGYDERLQRYAAVKVINSDFNAADQAEYTERFRREARAIARLHHPNIVGVYQFGEFEGNYYMAMVFLDGKDLRQILKEYAERGEHMPLPDVLSIIKGMCSALDYAHSHGVIHRDIKPSNIVIDTDTRPILTDFGLALNTAEGTLGDTFGSAHYIAPEQAISSAKAVPQSDLYSLGVCLYEMLAGKVPFDDPSAMSVALKHLNDAPPPPHLYNPGLSPSIEHIVLKMLDKDPGQRYPNGAAFAQALEDAILMKRSGAGQDVIPADTDRNAVPAEGAKTDRTAKKPRRTRTPKAKALTEDAQSTPLKPPIGLPRPDISGLDSKPPVILPDVPVEPARPSLTPAAGSKPEVKAEARVVLPANSASGAQSRRRVHWLVPLLGVILILGLGGIFASGALKGAYTATSPASVKTTNSTIDIRTQAAQTSVAIAATQTTTTVRTGTRTVTPTATPTASKTITRTATQAASPTGTNVATASTTTVPVSTGGDRASALSLVYDENQLDVINMTNSPVDISDLAFVQNGKTILRFDVPKYWVDSPYPSNAMPPQFCYQVYRIDRPQPAVLGNCRVAAWSRVSDTRWAWKAQDSSISSFNVLLGERVIATCSIKAGHCDISLS